MGVVFAFTEKYDIDSFECFCTMEKIYDEETDTYLPVKVLWDTGSNLSCISPAIAEKLNLKSIGSCKVNNVYDEYMVKVYSTCICINDTQRFMENVFISDQITGNCDVILGLNIISLCDFTTSCDDKYVYLSVRYPSQGKIDYTK